MTAVAVRFMIVFCANRRNWRNELRRAIKLAIEAGHFRADTDATQLAFEIYSLMLGLHHEGSLFGYEEARRLADVGLERLFAGYRPRASAGNP